jgi:hypothetical protein
MHTSDSHLEHELMQNAFDLNDENIDDFVRQFARSIRQMHQGVFRNQ